ncbi:hypothetical protein HNY73_010255 [Argiope bruennichi]|uniref:Uncharacterized protein n=1 Tax=Argiope bruennichi TaxID=94029 RepID=A0A8T0F2A9_ARGBR|nr:hypothetical protein HNY73_010255 [Argiope bruennichi]
MSLSPSPCFPIQGPRSKTTSERCDETISHGQHVVEFDDERGDVYRTNLLKLRVFTAPFKWKEGSSLHSTYQSHSSSSFVRE